MYWLGPFEYASKQELLGRLKQYLATAPTGRITHPAAVQNLHLLIAQHPDAERKIGPGVDHFRVARNALGAGQGLWLVRRDGTQASFSYKRCISGVQQSAYGKTCEALRFAVRPQLMAFRDTLTLPVTCALSGQKILKREDLHIDHKVPFWKLLRAFANARQLDLSELETTGSGETLALVDQDITRAFIACRQRRTVETEKAQSRVRRGVTSCVRRNRQGGGAWQSCIIATHLI